MSQHRFAWQNAIIGYALKIFMTQVSDAWMHLYAEKS